MESEQLTRGEHWPDDRRDERRRRIADLYHRGWSQRQIAKDVGIAPSLVFRELQVLQRAWRMAAMQDFDRMRAREFARIDHLENEYWKAWERSLEPRTITVTGDRETLTTEMRVGNPQFLAGVQWCIDRRCRLFGLDAPPKVTMEIVDAEAQRIAEAYGLDKRVVVREVEELLALQAPA